jgi:class 3 adenylate cyclase
VNEARYWLHVLDAEWRFVFSTDELRVSFGDTGTATVVPIGSHFWSPEGTRFLATAVGGTWADRDHRRAGFSDLGPYMLATMPGGRDQLQQLVDPEFADLIEEIQPAEVPAAWAGRYDWSTAGVDVPGAAVWFRIDDEARRVAGFGLLTQPAVGMTHLAHAAANADLAHIERMRVVASPNRRPAAILMADLEASTPLARRLSSAQYFAFGRRLVRAADDCIIDAGGIVGRHAGDGVVAFFLAETAGSESAAARSCILAARALRSALRDAAARSEIPEADVSLRFGLHWGSTLFMGRIVTRGRSEVTALGDEVNEAARIEACAAGGRTLASKPLVERLTAADAEALEIDIRHTTYTPLADLETATDKARRDAPAIAVCEV